MSKASDVRDAVLDALQTQLTGQTVEAFVVPNYTNEELQSGPRVIVRNGGRNVSVGQGVDTQEVFVEVGVVGVVGPKASASTTYKAEELAKADEYDLLMESIIDLWRESDSETGPLRRVGMANHSFEAINQAIQVDAAKLYDESVWLSMIRLTYRDSED